MRTIWTNCGPEHGLWCRVVSNKGHCIRVAVPYDAIELALILNQMEESIEGKDHELFILRNLAREHEIDRERADTYERYLTDIGRSIGCGHIDDRLPSCVREVLESRAEP